MVSFTVFARAHSRVRAAGAHRHRVFAWLVLSLLSSASAGAHAQDAGAGRVLDSLVARALAVHPELAVAEARVAVARARIGPAGARPDPMLMLGIRNFPVSDPGFGDFMTMKMVGVEQVFPYRGKLALRSRSALANVRAAGLHVEAERRRIAREVREAYYDVVEARLELDNMRRQQALLSDLVPAADVQYASGDADLRKALLVRREAATIAIDAGAVHEAERAALARLNAALDQDSEAIVTVTGFPLRVLRAAGADPAARVSVMPAALGARAPDSPLLPLDSLQRLAVENNAALQSHAATIDAQSAALGLARKAHLPDIGVAVSYAHRSGFADMVTATLTVPLPAQRGRAQDEQVAEERAELAVREAEHHAGANLIRAEVARLVAELERERTRIALLHGAVLPLDRASVDASTANFRAGRADLTAVLTAYGAQFRTATQSSQTIARVGRVLAQLEELVGTEVMR